MDLVASPTSELTKPVGQLSGEPEQEAGLGPSRSITFEDEPESAENKPHLMKHVSNPTYNSPLRHHRRNVSSPHHVKESLNAHSEYITSQDDGVAEHRINQYIIKQEIGRGSFGAVHLAVDQYGNEYAVKEFSKARLRKRAQSHILRTPLSQRRAGALAAHKGFNSPLHRTEKETKESAIELIKEEIAIMKKLNHPNLVSLMEVLDDPSEDSLYMVMEMCKKGVVMRVGLEDRADPYTDDQCRVWFRDLLLGIEYLHAQGVVHRDIKPDNCLITNDDVLKVVDFGVSEMFEKDTEMVTAKSAGSPAFLPPELCVARHGDISGKAADIWSMGVTLYCLKYGKIPFEKSSIFDLYDCIKDDQPDLATEKDKDFLDLMYQILEKNPSKRIKMKELREHPWVTRRGTDPLLSEEENISNLVEPPTEAEMNAAITSNMRNLLTVVKAVNKFKSLTASKRPKVLTSILGEDSERRFSQPPSMIQKNLPPLPHLDHRSHSQDDYDRSGREGALVVDGVHKDYVAPDIDTTRLAPLSNTTSLAAGRMKAISDPPPPLSTENSNDSDQRVARLTSNSDILAGDFPPFRTGLHHSKTADELGHHGQAHDPLQDQLYLYIGPSTFAGASVNPDRRGSFMPTDEDVPIVSESPGAADIDIYETAYRDEIERIKARAREQQREEPAVYLVRRVDARLLAISGRVGRLAAVGEESFHQLRDYTQWRERRAKVTEVSRALREAAKEEYVRQKQAYDAARLERTKTKTGEGEEPSGHTDASGAASPGAATPTTSTSASEQLLLQKSLSSPSQWTGRAMDKGKTSLMGLMDMVKTKSRTMRGSK